MMLSLPLFYSISNPTAINYELFQSINKTQINYNAGFYAKLLLS